MDTILLGIDFGSEHIRVTEARLDPSAPLALHPEIIEFDGQPSLRNAILLNPNRADYTAIGQDALSTSYSSDTSDLMFQSLSLEDHPTDQRGQATDLVLEEIRRIVGLDRLSAKEREAWRTLIALPISAPDETGQRWTERLAQVDFPTPQAIDSAQAILWGYFYPSIPPGTYLIVDCGARATRLAICQTDQKGRIQVKATRSGRPGGRDFDRVLLEHLGQDQESAAAGRRLALQGVIQDFKQRFAHSLIEGKDRFRYYDRPTGLDLALSRDDFESQTVAGGLITEFRHTIQQFMIENDVNPATLSGILLAGGGAHWPFVSEWARQVVPPDRVYLDEYPENIIALGLPFLVSASVRQQPQATPASPSSPNVRSISPAKAFWLEFVGGLLGVLGLGWFFEVRNVPISCLGLLGWWGVLAIALVGLSVLSVARSNAILLLILIPIWILGPLLSAIAAHRSATRRRSRTGGGQ
ncbi:MAG TPA: hypothetical protein ENI90_09200 [Methylothermaceae bacterium]|nr:hypothetical protein [Methylothermaceae bacterium]